nr:immunoglobulin light chain junction region [Macaca mulatta]
WMIWHNNVVLF